MEKKRYIVPLVESSYFQTQDMMKVSQPSDREFGPEASPAPERRTEVF